IYIVTAWLAVEERLNLGGQALGNSPRLCWLQVLLIGCTNDDRQVIEYERITCVNCQRWRGKLPQARLNSYCLWMFQCLLEYPGYVTGYEQHAPLLGECVKGYRDIFQIMESGRDGRVIVTSMLA